MIVDHYFHQNLWIEILRKPIELDSRAVGLDKEKAIVRFMSMNMQSVSICEMFKQLFNSKQIEVGRI